ncbi:MAG TPA: NADH-quinone oxidoreductase subunit NuoN [Rhodanobacteraceae bacterium]|nr:NADH-quinone oxidoreductase subunit NuoN [Rhodanobacteraceae bacterium]
MPSWNDILVMLPEFYLLAAACVLLLMDAFLRPSQRRVTHYTAIGVVIITIWLVLSGGGDGATAFNRMFVRDGMAEILKVFVLLSVALVCIYSRPYLRDRGLHIGEFYALLLFAALGAMLLVSAGNLVMVYLGLQLLSLCSYALVAMDRDSARSSEAAVKYFILSALAGGLLLYGMSMIYGATGSLDLAQIHAIAPRVAHPHLLVFGLVFLVAGIAFELGIAPFHMWLPDVYDGAPTAVVTFISTVPKLAAVGLAFRLLEMCMGTLAVDWQMMLAVLAAVSLVIGNFVAIMQPNIKRMLAYSTIAHMGFVLLGLAAATPAGYAAAVFYVVCYALMAAAAFGVIMLLARAGFEAENISDFKGLNQRSPWFAGVMALAMFSLAGIPPLFGFYAKLLVLESAIHAGLLWLAIVAIITSIVGLFYYLRVVKVMYFDAPDEGADQPLAADRPLRWVLSLNGLALIGMGIFWGPLLAWCLHAFGA